MSPFGVGHSSAMIRQGKQRLQFARLSAWLTSFENGCCVRYGLHGLLLLSRVLDTHCRLPCSRRGGRLRLPCRDNLFDERHALRPTGKMRRVARYHMLYAPQRRVQSARLGHPDVHHKRPGGAGSATGTTAACALVLLRIDSCRGFLHIPRKGIVQKVDMDLSPTPEGSKTVGRPSRMRLWSASPASL